MFSYVALPTTTDGRPLPRRLGHSAYKIGEPAKYLESEVLCREQIKKYRRGANLIASGPALLSERCALLQAPFSCRALASGVGFVAGIALEGVTGVAGLIDGAGI